MTYPTIDCGPCSLCCSIPGDRVIRQPTYLATYTNSRGQRCLANKLDGSCLYLGKDGNCTVYHSRPELCRQFSCLDVIGNGNVDMRVQEAGKLARFRMIHGSLSKGISQDVQVKPMPSHKMRLGGAWFKET